MSPPPPHQPPTVFFFFFALFFFHAKLRSQTSKSQLRSSNISRNTMVGPIIIWCLSIATWQSGDDIRDFWRLSFEMLMIRVQWILHKTQNRLCNVTSEYNSTFVFWCFASNSEFFKRHTSINDFKWTVMYNVLASSITCFSILTLHVHTHHQRLNCIAERAVRRVRQGTSASKWKLISRFHEVYVTDLVSDLKTSYERRFGKPFNGPVIPFGICWISPYLCERPVKNPSIWKESFTRIVPWIRSRGELEGWCICCRPRGVGSDGRIGIYSKRLNVKEVIFPQKGEFFLWTNQNPWRRSGTENILVRHGPIQGESNIDFLENQQGLFHNLTTHFRMPVKW